MSEMIKKVAKAICREHIINVRYFDNKSEEYLQKAVEDNYCDFLKIAMIAIEAMREPTDSQRNEYYKIKIEAGNLPINSCFMDAEWERMIDAVLK